MHLSRGKPRVSVLVSLRNAAGTLGVALRSVLHSRGGVDLEVIAVDHASTDDTRTRLVRFAQRDPRVVVVDAAAELDLAGALEVGRAAITRGTSYVARFDADDVMHPDRLAADVAFLDQNPDVDVVASRAKLLPRHRLHGTLASYVAWQNATLTAEDHAREIWIEQPLLQPASTFRPAALVYRAPSVVAGVAVPEDYALYLRLIVEGRRIVKRPVIHHGWRRHAATSTRFSRDVLALMKARALVDKFAPHNVFIAGAGKEGGRIARALIANDVHPAGFLDVSEKRIGRIRHGVEVLPASALASLRGRAFVVAAIGTSGARGVVRAQLDQAGFVEGVDAVVVA